MVVCVDLGLIVASGGVSLLGPASGSGFAARVVAILVLLFASGRAGGERARRLHAYAALLILLLPLLHYRGYRLRGDGLWYYSFAHSVAFDGDIDLGNQYTRLGIESYTGSTPVRETGRPRYTFPVGGPIAWIPFFGVGHVAVWLRNAHGLETAYDGFSDPYFHAVALGNLLIGWAGLLVLDRLLRKWFSPYVAFLATIGTGLGSFLFFYLTYHAIYTHALTFLIITLFVARWADGPESLEDFALLGLLAGAGTCVRWQSAVFVILPGLTLVRRLWRREWRPVLVSGLLFSAAFLFAVLPQLLTWKTIFGRALIGVPLGSGYMRWSEPFVTEVLFSSRHGLFSWSPLLIFAVFGLVAFAWRQPWTGVPLAFTLALLTFINGSVSDWWGGGSFGARRFDSALPIFALGLATSIGWAADFARRRPKWVVGGVIALFIAYNGLLMEQYRKGRLPADDTMSWQAASEGMLEDVFDWVGYPFSFPMNWLFAERYDRPKTQYDILVGKYLFHPMQGLGGVIDIGQTDPPFIGNGWSGVKDWEGRPRGVRFAVGPRAGVFVPVGITESLRIFVDCAVPPGATPRAVEVWLNGTRLGSVQPGADMAEHVVTAPAELWERINLLELVPAERAGEEPYLAVDRLRFERVSALR